MERRLFDLHYATRRSERLTSLSTRHQVLALHFAQWLDAGRLSFVNVYGMSRIARPCAVYQEATSTKPQSAPLCRPDIVNSLHRRTYDECIQANC
jgi:hypothetical protein